MPLAEFIDDFPFCQMSDGNVPITNEHWLVQDDRVYLYDEPQEHEGIYQDRFHCRPHESAMLGWWFTREEAYEDINQFSFGNYLLDSSR